MLLACRITWLLFSAALACLAGCGSGGPRTYPIPGKLVYEDGSSAGAASVVLQTNVDQQTVSARGMASSEGKFTLTTFKDRDGVVAGEHQVSISPVPVPEGVKSPHPPIPQQYWDFSTSNLKATVSPETPEIVITIQRTGNK